jgi:glycosyltransferase involved in cell wall biosynthesis
MNRVLVITRWFPNIKEPIKCIFVKNIIDAQVKYTDDIFYVISPVPYGFKFLTPFISNTIKKKNATANFEENLDYSIFRPLFFKFPRSIFYKLSNYFYFRSVLSVIKMKKLTFDIIHTHGFFPDAYVAVKVAKLFNKPVFVHLHDSNITDLFKEYPTFSKFIIENSTRLLPVSNFQKKLVQDFFPDFSKKINTVYNGVEIGENDIYINSKSENSISSNKLVYIGRLTKQKGVQILINAIKEVVLKNNTIKLDIFGEGPDAKEFLLLTKHLNLEKIITFKGIIDNKEIKNKLPDYKMLIVPSLYESFGIVSIEAFSCGIPVIASNICAIPEIISSPELGILVETGNVVSLAAGILSAIQIEWNKEYITTYSRNFSISNTAKNIKALYDKK